jgi:hypothetical protein
MKTSRTVEEVVDHGNTILIKDLRINSEDAFKGDTYDLQIINTLDGRLYLNFNHTGEPQIEQAYTIIIREGGVYFSRRKLRTTHDHDDNESLQIRVDEKDPTLRRSYIGEDLTEHVKQLLWMNSFPHTGTSRRFIAIPFGARIE